MRVITDKKVMKSLYRMYKGNYHKMAIWLKGSKTWGDGSYNYQVKCTCKTCGNRHLRA